MLSNYITRPCIRRQSAEAVGRYGIAKRPAYCSCLLPPILWWLWVDSNHQPRAYETLALPLSYTADHQEAGAVGRSRRFAKRTPLPTAAVFCLVSFWGPAEELNLVPSAQLLRVGLEDRCRERGPWLEAMVRIELTPCCLQDSCSTSWSYIASLMGDGA